MHQCHFETLKCDVIPRGNFPYYIILGHREAMSGKTLNFLNPAVYCYGKTLYFRGEKNEKFVCSGAVLFEERKAR